MSTSERKTINRACEVCSAGFLARASEVRKGAARFCCRRCANVSRKIQCDVSCEHCNATFHATPSKLKSGRNRFCSAACRYANAKTPLAERFRKLVSSTPTDTGCLLWLGGTSKGYGAICAGGNSRRGGIMLPAHRVAYELAHGPIEDGLWVLHRCDNPPCVNVDHLFLGTRQDNIQDMVAKGRGLVGAHRSKRLNDAAVLEIRERIGDATSAQLANEFGVAKTTINHIVSRRTWQHV